MQRQYLVSRSGAADSVQERENQVCASCSPADQRRLPRVPHRSSWREPPRRRPGPRSRRRRCTARGDPSHPPRESAPPHCRQWEHPSRTRDQATFPETFQDFERGRDSFGLERNGWGRRTHKQKERSRRQARLPKKRSALRSVCAANETQRKSRRPPPNRLGKDRVERRRYQHRLVGATVMRSASV